MTSFIINVDGPHDGQSVEMAGESLAEADAAVVLCHGRGATASGMVGLAAQLDTPGVAYLAPQAARNAWYPRSFMAPIDDNEPWLSSALSAVGAVREHVAAAGIDAAHTVLLGFSQGACLASEYTVRNPCRYGGLVAFSGGLVGPAGTTFEYEGDLAGTPAFVGCSDTDPHIPVERVHETTAVLDSLGAAVDERIYEGMGHTVNAEELDAARDIVAAAAER